MTTNEVLLILLGLWSIGFWVCGWVANYKRRKRNDKRRSNKNFSKQLYFRK